MDAVAVKVQTKEERDFYRIAEGISLLYLGVIFLIYPFYFRNGYFDILQAKFSFFWISSLAYSAVMTLFLLLYAFTLKKEERSRIYTKLFFRVEKGRKKLFLPTDVFFLILIVIYCISMFLSGYIYETWWGSTGRFMGTFTWLLLFLDYFFLTRFYHFKKGHLVILSLSVFLQACWGISDFFWMNLFHFFDSVDNKGLWSTFAGGVGNINGYTSLMVSYTGLYAGLFLKEKNGKWSPLFLLMYMFTLLAAMYGMSDNAVFALFVLFLALPFFCFRKKEVLLQCIDLYLAFFLTMKLAVYLIPAEGSSYDVGDKGFFLQLGYTALPFLAIPVLGLLRLLVMKLREEAVQKLLRPLYYALFCFILCGVIFVFYDANVSHKLAFLANYRNYFLFDDAWGSGRGFIWKMGLNFFMNKMPLWQRIFGYGPDSYYMLTNDHYKFEVSQSAFGAIDNIHNEYLNILLTIGMTGLIAYFLFIFFSLKTLWEKEREGEESFSGTVFPFATGIGLLCYLGQAVINIAVPIVLPIIFILFFLGLGTKCRAQECSDDTAS